MKLTGKLRDAVMLISGAALALIGRWIWDHPNEAVKIFNENMEREHGGGWNGSQNTTPAPQPEPQTRVWSTSIDFTNNGRIR